MKLFPLILFALGSLTAVCPAPAGPNLLPTDKLKPFEATFDGQKIVKGNGPAAPFRVTKWQKDKAGFVGYGPLPTGGGDGFTLWTEAGYGPNLWLNPQALTPGKYRLTFDAKSAPEASWRLLVKFFGLTDPSLALWEPAPAGVEPTADKDGRTFRFGGMPEWRTTALEWTLNAPAQWNFDLGFVKPGGPQNPLFLRNVRFEKVGDVDPATVAKAQETAAKTKAQNQLKDFYGTLTGTVVSSDAEKVVLKVSRAYAYTPLADEAALAGQTITVPVPPVTPAGTPGQVRNLRGTLPRRELAVACFAALGVGQTVELGAYGDLNSGQANLARLPGPTTLASNASLPPHFGARVDEKAVKTTVFVAANGGNDATNDGSTAARSLATLERAFEVAKVALDRGDGVRILVAPGVYRPRSTLRLADYANKGDSQLADLSANARDAVFVIEAEKPDSVFIRGSVTAGFEPDTWTLVDAGKKVYKHAWTPNFGMVSRGYYKLTNVLLHRRELLALNGKILEPVLLEDYAWIDPTGTKYNEEIGLVIAGGGKVEGKTGYIYKGWRDPVATLQPGQFGVAEMGPGEKNYDNHPDPNTLFLRLPEGIATLDKALVEVGMLQTLLRVQDKSNLVLRNLTFEHSANFYNDYYEKAAVDTNAWGSFSESHDWLWDHVTLRNNRSSGAMLWWVRNATLRNCQFIDNGHLGIRPSFVNELVMENCQVNRNNVRGRQVGYNMHGVGGLDFTGQNCVFRNVAFNENFGCGFRSDYGLEDVLFENCDVSGNAGWAGVFHEIEFGPVLWRNSRITGNRGRRGFGILNVNRVTLEGCTLADNENGQFEFYVSPPRRRALEMQPLGWAKFEGNNETPRPDIRQTTFRNNTFITHGPGPLVGRFFKEGDAAKYLQFIRSDDFTANGNSFWCPEPRNAFEIGDNFATRQFTDLAGWQRLTGEDAHSVWKNP